MDMFVTIISNIFSPHNLLLMLGGQSSGCSAGPCRGEVKTDMKLGCGFAC